MDLPRYHRLRPAYYRLEGRRCPSCDTVQFPPREVCRTCRKADMEPHRLAGRGKIHSYTEMSTAAAGFEPPYLMALIELEEGPIVAAQLTDVDPGDVEIGLPVEMVTRRIREKGPRGYLVYGYKFRPVIARSGSS